MHDPTLDFSMFQGVKHQILRTAYIEDVQFYLSEVSHNDSLGPPEGLIVAGYDCI